MRMPWNKNIKMSEEYRKKCSDRTKLLHQIPPSRRGIKQSKELIEKRVIRKQAKLIKDIIEELKRRIKKGKE